MALASGIYRHYSGLMVLVLGVARHSDTDEKFVAYVPLGVKAGPRITVRPYDRFFDAVEVDGRSRPRFEYVSTEMPPETARDYRPLSQ